MTRLFTTLRDSKPLQAILFVIAFSPLFWMMTEIAERDPYYDAILSVACWAIFVSSIAWHLWRCWQLARGTEYTGILLVGIFFFSLPVLSSMTKIAAVLRLEDVAHIWTANMSAYGVIFAFSMLMERLLLKLKSNRTPERRD